uniref:ribonuclease H n=1 Tax=Pithovirus LCPAC201 TaxID=2506591 RepID=A0A481Z5D3_9VIRU|nr:MAG: ribonuclease H [Pithovirus LCPAC201]
MNKVSAGKIRWYAVIRFDWSHIFHNKWWVVKPYVNKISKVKYKGFDTEQGAKVWMSSFNTISYIETERFQLKSPSPLKILPRTVPLSTPILISPKSKTRLDAYTDGSYLFKTSSGGWAYILVSHENQTIIHHKSGHLHGKSTNNRAELSAILNVIIDQPDSDLDIYSDSLYSIKAITTWSAKWKRNGWKTSKNLPVENRDLIEEITDLISSRSIQFYHVKAHNGDYFNEMVDKMARQAAKI